jgi:hypothetical protein
VKNKKQFPTSMFATATIVSGLMVFVISAVFNQANQPCLSHHALHSNPLQNNLIIDTSGASRSGRQNTDSSEPMSFCNRDNQQIGWLTWLFNRSDSVEFHYLDLLELLSRK